MTSKAQQSAIDNALVAHENQHVIGKCNMRINPGMKLKESTYQVVLDALALTTCYPAFLITTEVPVIYMHQLWATVNKHKASYRFKINKKRFYMNVEVFKIYSTSVQGFRVKNLMNPQLKRKLYLLSMKLVILEKSTISSEETPSKKKPTKTKKYVSSKKKPSSKPKPTKKKAPVEAGRGKGLNVLSEVALSEAAQLKEASKRSKKDFHISQASGSGDGTDFESRVPDEQQRKTSDADEGTSTKPGDVPKYLFESENESWGDSDDDERNDDNSNKVTKDDGEDDVKSDANDDNEASDNEKIDSNEDENLNLNLNDDEEEEK
ncbi:hypothetical protein Tco_1098803 [Tanacetum coccineum]